MFGISFINFCRTGIGALAFIIGFASIGLYANGQDWPRWGGANANMLGTETGWAKDWLKRQPKQLWKQEIGIGFSSVSVVADKLYTMGRLDGQDAVYCIQASSGKEIWKHTYDCGLVAVLHEGGPGATPTVANGRVYTLSREGHAICFDADSGEVVWKKFLPDITGVAHIEWGFTGSPLIVGNKAVFEAGCLTALDSETGELIWKTKAYVPGYGSPISFQHEGKSEIATLNNDGLLIVDEETGEEKANQAWITGFDTNSTTPIYHEGKFFISTGYKRGCGMFEYVDGQLKEVFTSRQLSNHMNNSVIYDGHIYGVHGNSSQSRNCRLVCLDAKTGEAKWAMRGVGCGSIVVVDGYIIALSDKGQIACGKANPNKFTAEGAFVALKGKCWTVPVLANKRLFCRNAKGELVCYQLANANRSAALTNIEN